MCDDNIRIIECPHCEGERRIYIEDWDSYDSYECSECNGTGGVEIEVEPVTLEDLERIDFECFLLPQGSLGERF